MVTSFADGSKISFEQSIVANATGFKVRSRGMSRGLAYKGDIMEIGKLYDLDELRELGGVVDYVVGTPLTKVYCLAEHSDPKQQHYLNLYKMGPGPLYSFFIPYHLVHFEVPSAVARVALFGDCSPNRLVLRSSRSARSPSAIFRRRSARLPGRYMTYGEACNSGEMRNATICGRLVEGCVETCDRARSGHQVFRRQAARGRLADAFRAEQNMHFFGAELDARGLPSARTAEVVA